MGPAARRNRCVRPSLRCRISSAFFSTRKCLEIAGTEIENGRASSVPEASPRARRSKMARRVGSASAKKTVVSCSDESLTMKLIVRRSWIVVKGPLSPSHRSALNRTQREQRCLLRLGQSPDPVDSKSLVGSVTPQSPQLLPALEVPQVNGPVIPATGQPAAIGTSPERTDRPLMRLSHPHALPALHIPPAQHAVTTPTDQQVPARAPGDGIDDTAMPRKGSITCPPGRVALPALLIPHQQLPSAFDAASTGQPRPIGAPDHARDHPLMAR